MKHEFVNDEEAEMAICKFCGAEMDNIDYSNDTCEAYAEIHGKVWNGSKFVRL